MEDVTGVALTRRTFLKRAGTTGAALTLPAAIAACGSSSSSEATSGKAAAGLASVRLGIEPYADHSIYIIGIRKGWFREAGIDVEPKPDGFSLVDNQVVPELVNGRLDVSSNWGPFRIQTAVSAPTLRMFGFADTYTGTY